MAHATAVADGLVTIPLSIPVGMDTYLSHTRSGNFAAQQPGRFLALEATPDDWPEPEDAVFVGGTIYWTETFVEALLLRAYEVARGHAATIACDEAGFGSGWAIFSSQRFPYPPASGTADAAA